SRTTGSVSSQSRPLAAYPTRRGTSASRAVHAAPNERGSRIAASARTRCSLRTRSTYANRRFRPRGRRYGTTSSTTSTIRYRSSTGPRARTARCARGKTSRSARYVGIAITASPSQDGPRTRIRSSIRAMIAREDGCEARPVECPAMIRVERLRKKYDGFLAVNDLSFEVSPGEILGLVGPNGAGKTTTLRTLAGILPPTEGRVEIGGFDVVTSAVEAKRRLAYVPDTPHPFDLLTVEEHLRFTALAYRVEGAEERFSPLLAELELTEKRHELAPTLSRGMQQKLAIACAFLREPSAILLDEPLTGLDPRGIRDMREAVARRARAGA